MPSTWKCPNCSVENDMNADRCSCCEDPKPKGLKQAEVQPAKKKDVPKRKAEEDEEEYEGGSDDVR